MFLGIRTTRLSNHCNGLNIDTLTRKCPGILKSTADRETYTSVRIHEWTQQVRKKLKFKEKLALCIFILPEKFEQFDWLRAVVFQLNLKYLHIKITVTMVTQNHQIMVAGLAKW